MDTNATVAEFLRQSPLPLWINGEGRASRDTEEMAVLSPSTGEQVAAAACAGTADVADAVAAASAAFGGWAGMAPSARAEVLNSFADVLDAHQDVLASLETLDVGKPIGDSRGFDIPFAIRAYRYYADLASKDGPTSIDVPGVDVTQRGVARGVCALIHPWNAPFLLSTWSIAPALAAGNTVVLKPSELTPLTSLYMARLAVEAGIPPGVVNVVPGPGPTAGEALINHRDVAMISFTGSPDTGRRIAAAAAERLIPTKLELGGKGAALVLDDVDVGDVARQLVNGLVLNAGQVCFTATRWVVHESIVDELVATAADRLQALSIGPGDRDGTQMGPLISAQARDRVLGLLDQGVDDGARFLLEGGPAQPEGAEGGFYVRPALMTGDPGNVCAQREIFGPVAYVLPFSDLGDAVEAVNATPYGLANSVWSNDAEAAQQIAGRLIAGNGWVNSHDVFAYGLPYGGLRMSGWGGGVNSAGTLRDYQHTLTVSQRL